MERSDIEHMAQGYPPSHIGKDCEEVITWLATQLLATQEQRDALSAKGLELCSEAAHVYQKYNVTQMPDMDLVDCQTIQEFSELANQLRAGEPS